MPIFHPVQQNTEQWQNLRGMVPTASEMHRIVCSEYGSIYKCSRCEHVYANARKWCDQCSRREATVERVAVVRPSASQNGYMYRLIAASFGYQPDEAVPNKFMENGHLNEASAVAEYEFMTGRDTQQVGFVTTDDGLIGASPDRLVGDDGLLECKCPSEWVHIRHMVENDLESDHRVQIQGQLLVTGRQWVDAISWCKGFPSVIIRVERDEEFISGMNDLLVEFITKYQRTRAELIAKYGNFARLAAESKAAEDPMHVTMADADVIAASQEWQDSSVF